MPPTFEEYEKDGKHMCKIYTHHFKSEPQYLHLGVGRAKAILANQGKLQEFVQKYGGGNANRS